MKKSALLITTIIMQLSNVFPKMTSMDCVCSLDARFGILYSFGSESVNFISELCFSSELSKCSKLGTYAEVAMYQGSRGNYSYGKFCGINNTNNILNDVSLSRMSVESSVILSQDQGTSIRKFLIDINMQIPKIYKSIEVDNANAKLYSSNIKNLSKVPAGSVCNINEKDVYLGVNDSNGIKVQGTRLIFCFHKTSCSHKDKKGKKSKEHNALHTNAGILFGICIDIFSPKVLRNKRAAWYKSFAKDALIGVRVSGKYYFNKILIQPAISVSKQIYSDTVVYGTNLGLVFEVNKDIIATHNDKEIQQRITLKKGDIYCTDFKIQRSKMWIILCDAKIIIELSNNTGISFVPFLSFVKRNVAENKTVANIAKDLGNLIENHIKIGIGVGFNYIQ